MFEMKGLIIFQLRRERESKKSNFSFISQSVFEIARQINFASSSYEIKSPFLIFVLKMKKMMIKRYSVCERLFLEFDNNNIKLKINNSHHM